MAKTEYPASLQSVADEFEAYTAQLYKAYPGGAAADPARVPKRG